MIPLLPLIACPDRTDSVRTDSVRTNSARTNSARTDSARTDSARTDSVRTDSVRADSARIYAVADKDLLLSVGFSSRRGEIPYIEVVPDANPATEADCWEAVRDRVDPAATSAKVDDTISMNWLSLRVPAVHKQHMHSFFASLKMGMGSAAYEVFSSLLAAGALRIMFADDCSWDAFSTEQLGTIMTRPDLLNSMRIFPSGRGRCMIMPLKTIIRHAWNNCRRIAKRARGDEADSESPASEAKMSRNRDELAELKDELAELRAHAARLEEQLLLAEVKVALAEEMDA
jgi:hypothetical protein